jgi:PP-loop superfamily ATP-utilizing enzyme
LGDKAFCVTGESASLAAHQRIEIDRIASQFGFRHETIQTEELDNQVIALMKVIVVTSARMSCIAS